MDDGAAIYYRCTSCKKNVRDEDTSQIPEFGVKFCPECAEDLGMLERIAEGLRRLPDEAGQTLEGQSTA